MLLIHTQEIEASFVGFPLSVELADDCTCDGDGGCSSCNVARLTFHAHERDDGACEQWLVFEAGREEMRRVLREALDLLGEEPE